MSEQIDEQRGEQILFAGGRQALIGGILAALVAIGGQLLVGQVYSGTEARGLVQAMVPSIRSVAGSIVQASATILALMLAMLSLSRAAINELERSFFRRVERIGLLSSMALGGSIILLMLVSIPVDQSPKVPTGWFTTVYYVLIVLTATITGLLVATVVTLYNAIQTLIQVVGPFGPQPDERMQKDSPPKQAEGKDQS